MVYLIRFLSMTFEFVLKVLDKLFLLYFFKCCRFVLKLIMLGLNAKFLVSDEIDCLKMSNFGKKLNRNMDFELGNNIIIKH